MCKNILYIIILVFFVTSCGETFSSVKRGLTGAKANSADEFLVQKKDPLVLPPDFEKNLETLVEDDTSSSSSIESSILKKIKSK